MTEKGFTEIIQFVFLPMCWAYTPGILKIFMAAAERLGMFSPTGNGSNGISPMMLSTEKYQLLGIQVEHIYLTTHLPQYALSPLRE
jgi:hypothetical protein